MHVHNERNFPQAKLDSEINARFLLNELGDLYFLLLIIVYKSWKKDESVQTKHVL